MTKSTTGVPVATTACSSASCPPGSSRLEREAASPIMFCHSPRTSTATSDSPAKVTARSSSASSSNPAEVTGALLPNMSNIDGKVRTAGRMPGA